MPKKPAWPLFVFAGVAASVIGVASAAGLGAGASVAVLGQPLDFAVQVRLDAGEALAPECVTAEVTVGDRRMPASLVRTALEMTGAETARIRIITSQAIDEPVVAVVLHAGCAAARLTRRFVVLADPPITPITPMMSSAANNAAAYTPAFAAAPTLVASTSATAGVAAYDGGPRAAADATAVPAATVRSVASRSNAGNTTDTPRVAVRRVARANQAVETPRRVRRPLAPRALPAAVAAAPRLRLDVAEPAPSAQAAAVDQALQAVAQAASAARAAAVAASAASDRIATLERAVDGLRKEAQAGRDLVAQMRERVARAEGAGTWTWPLLAVVLVLLLLAAWLGWRLNGAERARQRAWQAAAGARPAPASELTSSRQPTSPIPFVTSEIRLPTPPASGRARAAPAWPAPAPVDPPSTLSPLVDNARVQPAAPPVAIKPPPAPKLWVSKEPPAQFPYDNAMQRTEVMPPRAAVSDDTAPRDVSIEELIDLEQQAEFFIVLGQEEAAIDLLVEHLRHTGGGSPLPYLKLLEVYRRRGDRDDYARLRQRFNQRFNAYAPDWDDDLLAGRTLENYSGVIPRLQQVWARPLDAMAELEALLFRKARGDLFELPAYREVLFLYALARDLHDRQAADTGNVDLLLPLADGGDFSSTAPAPFLGLERDSEFDAHALDNRPTMPLDFDLTSQRDRPTSIFGPLDDAEPRRR